MNIPCNIPCQTCTPFVPGTGSSPADPDYPFINLSSEAPDSDPFIGRRYGPPPGDPGGGPPLGNLFYAIGCLGFCVSAISQEDADLCAQRQEMECLGTNWPQVPQPPPVTPPPLGPFPPPSFPPTPLFGNSPQSCDFTCPDGQKFTFTVAAGTFVSFSQAAADAAANTYACKKAIELRLCMGSLSPSVQCAGTEYTGSISVSSGLPPVTFIIVGDVPEGLLQSQSIDSLTFFLTGVVLTPGDYTFTVVASDREGHTMQRACALTFFGITTDASLPDGTEGEPYVQAIVTGGTVIDAVTFTLVGALPNGLSFNLNTGVISGTIDDGVSGEFSFTITAHADGLSCPKEFFMVVGEAPSGCPDWSTLVWQAPIITLAGDGTASESSSGASFNAQSACGNVGFDNQGTLSQITDELAFENTEEVECHVTIETSVAIGDDANWNVSLFDNAAPSTLISLTPADGVGVFSFTIPPGVHLLQAAISVSVTGGIAGANGGSVQVAGFFGLD